MKRNNGPTLITVALFSVLALAIVAGAQAESTEAIRIPAEAAAELRQLTLHPIHDLDYGSFRWLEVEASDIGRLRAAGIPFTKVEGFGEVRVMGFSFDPLVDGEPEIPESLRARSGGSGLTLIQLIAPLRQEWQTALTDLGVELLQYYPHQTYLAWLSPSQSESLGRLSFVRWSGAFHPAYKLNDNLSGRSGTVKNIDVMFFADDKTAATLDELRDLGGHIITHHPSQPDRVFFNAIVELDATKIADVARLDHILWLGFQSPIPVLDDEMSDQIVAGNHPGGVPETGYQAHLLNLGVDGTNVIWATIDTGVDYAHPDLNTHIVGGYSFPGAPASPPGNDCSGGGHGTHVTGIIGGDASAGYADADGFLYGLGMAPSYSIFAMNSLCGSGWPPTGGWQEHSKQAVLGSAIGGNNSWTTSEGTQHGYQASERTHDLMVRDGNFDTAATAEPFIEVFSAGNSGTSGLTSPKEAKNLIVTASTLNYRGGNDIDGISSFSSRGPAVDGRWVPTIAVPGSEIASALRQGGASQCTSAIAGTNNTYSWCSGTSMAAPHTSGSLVLITEWWRGFNSGDNPSPAMAKALLVNSAVDMGTADIPNITEGWGRINVTDAIQPGVLVVYKDQETTFDDTGEVWTMTVGVDDPAQPLKISVAWSDAPGAVGANPALVNNLDLEVETDGSIYLGNDFSAGWSTTGGSADTLNNLENVFVASPGGQATITVRATNIAGDGVPYIGDATDQDFAIVCFNCAEEPDFTLDVTPASLEVCAPVDGVFGVDVGSILGFSEPVTLAASGEPTGTTVGFSTNPVVPGNASVMTVSQTGSAAPGSSIIEVSGTSAGSFHTDTVSLNLYDAIPSMPTLVTPDNGALNQPTRPTFEWLHANQAGTYRIQVATDPAFTSLSLDEAGIDGTTFTPDADLPSSTLFFWRVQASNGCGTGTWSGAFEFVTVALPGDCGPGTSPVFYFIDDLEAGTGAGWTHGGTGDTWQLSSARVHSGAWSFFADDVDTVTDQWLESEDIILPADTLPLTLQFWNWQEIEDRSGGCYDGGILEISTDSGSSWTQLEAQLVTDPYDGPVSTGSNPLGGLNAWCGDPQDWLESVVDLDAYAGQTIRFRLRLGTDSYVGHEGWYIDDVVIQGCAESGLLFSDGFESGDTALWTYAAP
ncbi:MAG: S8 family serine peptidase [Acidobacteria bacterium]|nr:S8 family serine peptidase [Acidobacteriota bacterium]